MPSVNADLADRTLSHSVTLLRLQAGETQEVMRQLARLERDLIKDLHRANLTSFRKDRYERLLKQTRQTIRGHYKTIRDTQQKEMEELAGLESTWTVRSLNGAISEPIGVYVDIASVAWTEAQLKAIASNAVIDGSPAKSWWAKQATDTQRRFADEVKQGLLRGSTNEEIIARVRGTKDANYTDGVMHLSRVHAETLVRSSVQAVAHDARRDTYKQNQELIRGIRHISTLDGATSEICIAYDKKMWSLPDHTPIGHELPYKDGVPRHFRCRSTETAVLKAFSELAGKTLPPADNQTIEARFRERLRQQGWSEERIAAARRRTQASMNGQVPDEVTVFEFLSGKSEDWQNTQLGKGKAELFRQGLLMDPAQLLDVRGNPLTTKQLRQQLGTMLPLVPPPPVLGSVESLAQWETAKTIEELAAMTRQRWKHITADFVGLSPEVMKSALRNFEKNAADWPEVAKQVTYIGSRQDFAWKQGTYAHAQLLPQQNNTFMLGLHKEFFGDETKFVESLARSEKLEWHPKGTNHIGGIVDHEFGHFVDYWIRTSVVRDQSLHPEGWVTAGGAPEARTIFDQWKGKAYRTLKKSKAKKWQLSGYAKYNENEAFAEAFAALRNGNRSSAYTRQMEFILEAIRKAKPATDFPRGAGPDLYAWVNKFLDDLEKQ